MTQRTTTRRTAGFTLIEIMVVVIVIGVLSALILPSFLGRAEKARVATAKQQISVLETAITLFQSDYARFPETLEDLVEKPSDIDESQWTPPTIKEKNLDDPWGNRFVYRQPGDNGPFDLLSMGSDGVVGGEDDGADVVNW